MAPEPLEILKKGLAKFIERIKPRKDELIKKLARSDEEIYRAVISSIEARENMEIVNGGDDANEDMPIEPRPTRRDVLLKAVPTIGRYIDDLNDPIARKF